MKKALIVISAIILTVALLSPAFWDLVSPNNDEDEKGFGQLKVQSLAGEYEVYVDKNLIGSVEDKGEKVFTRISAGKREVEIVRKSSVDNFYFKLIRQIDFLPSTQVELNWEAGPSMESSSGILKYFTRVTNPGGSELLVIPFPADSEILINSSKPERNLIDITDIGERKVLVKNSEQFIPNEFTVFLKDESNNTVPKNIRLIVEVYLYKKPI